MDVVFRSLDRRNNDFYSINVASLPRNNDFYDVLFQKFMLCFYQFFFLDLHFMSFSPCIFVRDKIILKILRDSVIYEFLFY